jgi:hypothetical protein
MKARLTLTQNIRHFLISVTQYKAENKEKLLYLFTRSTLCFICAYLLLSLTYQAVTLLIASLYGIPVYWDYSRIQLPEVSQLYTRTKLIVIFSAGPLLCLLLAFCFYRLINTPYRFFRRFRLFYLWCLVLSLNFFFGSYISGVMTRTEFNYASEWLLHSRLFDLKEMILVVVAALVLIGFSALITPLFISVSVSKSMVQSENRFSYYLAQVVFPWMFGSLILLILMIPSLYLPYILRLLTPGLILLPALYTISSIRYDRIPVSPRKKSYRIKQKEILLVVLLLFFYRLSLQPGWLINGF